MSTHPAPRGGVLDGRLNEDFPVGLRAAQSGPEGQGGNVGIPSFPSR